MLFCFSFRLWQFPLVGRNPVTSCLLIICPTPHPEIQPLFTSHQVRSLVTNCKGENPKENIDSVKIHIVKQH